MSSSGLGEVDADVSAGVIVLEPFVELPGLEFEDIDRYM